MEESLKSIKASRVERLNQLIKIGINPYPSKLEFKRIPIVEARDKGENSTVSVAGRITSQRNFGALAFFDVTDATGKIQIILKKDTLDTKKLPLLELLDTGDFIECTGSIFTTKSGELTIQVSNLNLLSKALRPLPSAHFGLKDEEERYRQRYVDFAINPELKELFVKKSIFWNTMRAFLSSRGFLEVETPVLENTAGGADAEPFVTHHNALDVDLYLRISMGELWQKRLMVGGFEKTFEIGRQFRNEGISREHLQDYTQMEF
ncbi:MAG: amino acid--tRNA ligase-related protein, partial [Patescibacteria group bacterium]